MRVLSNFDRTYEHNHLLSFARPLYGWSGTKLLSDTWMISGPVGFELKNFVVDVLEEHENLRTGRLPIPVPVIPAEFAVVLVGRQNGAIFEKVKDHRRVKTVNRKPIHEDPSYQVIRHWKAGAGLVENFDLSNLELLDKDVHLGKESVDSTDVLPDILRSGKYNLVESGSHFFS